MMDAITYRAFRDELEKISSTAVASKALSMAGAKALLNRGVAAAKKGAKAFSSNEAAVAGSAIGGGMGAYSNREKGVGSALKGALIGGVGGAAIGAGARHAAPGIKRYAENVAESAGARAAKGAIKKRTWLTRKILGEG
jgi:hypothetical protein